MKFNKNRMAKLAGIPQQRRSLNESRRRAAIRKRRMLAEARGYMDDPSFDAPDMTAADMMDDMDDYERRKLDDINMGIGRSASFDTHDEAEEGLTPYDYVDVEHGVTLPHEEDIPGPEPLTSYLRRTANPNAMVDDLEMMAGTMGSQSSLYADAYGYDDYDLYEGDHNVEEMMDEKMYCEDPDEMMSELDEKEYCEDEEKDNKKEEIVEIDDRELKKEVRNIRRKRINEARLKAVIEDELREVLAEMQYGSSWMYGEDKPRNSRKGSVTRGFTGLGFKK